MTKYLGQPLDKKYREAHTALVNNATEGMMNNNFDAKAVRAYVAAKWPQAMQSPLANAARDVVMASEIARAAEFLRMQSEMQHRELLAEAMDHALSCIDVCDAEGISYDEETLSFNVENAFPELTSNECDDIASRALNGDC